jgi:hypothetical protein
VKRTTYCNVLLHITLNTTPLLQNYLVISTLLLWINTYYYGIISLLLLHITTSLLHHYYHITAKLLHHYYSITKNWVCITTYYYKIMAQSFLHITSNYYPITTFLLPHYYSITFQLLHRYFVITTNCITTYYYSITTWLLRYYFTITTLACCISTFYLFFAGGCLHHFTITTHYYSFSLLLNEITTHYYHYYHCYALLSGATCRCTIISIDTDARSFGIKVMEVAFIGTNSQTQNGVKSGHPALRDRGKVFCGADAAAERNKTQNLIARTARVNQPMLRCSDSSRGCLKESLLNTGTPTSTALA